MNRNRLMVTALVTSAALSAAQLAITLHGRREDTRLVAVWIHQQLLGDHINHPKLNALWGNLEGLTEETQSHRLHANRWMSLWGLKFRARLISEDRLRDIVRNFLASEEGRAFWEWAREARAQQDQDSTDRRFHRVVDEVYEKRSR